MKMISIKPQWKPDWNGHTDDFAEYVLYNLYGSKNVVRAMHDAWAFARLYQIVLKGNKFVIETYNKKLDKNVKKLTDITEIPDGKCRDPVKIVDHNLAVPQERWIPMMVPYEQLDKKTRDIDNVPANVFRRFNYNYNYKDASPIYPFSHRSFDSNAIQNIESIKKSVVGYVAYIKDNIKTVIERALPKIENNDRLLDQLYKHAKIQDFIYGLYDNKAVEFANKHKAKLGFDDIENDNTDVQNRLAIYASENVGAMINLIEYESIDNSSKPKSMVRKCNDGRNRKVFRIPGKGNTLYARYLGRDVPVKSIPKKNHNFQS